MKVRRAGDQHHVDAALEHLLAAVEADKRMGLVDGELLGVFRLQLRPGGFDPFGKHVGHRHQAHVFPGVHRIGGGAGTAAAAADKPDLDRVAAGGMHAAGQRQGAARHGAQDGRPL